MNDELHKVVSGIGPKIKALRSENGLSLQALATRADVSAATIHKMEQGDMVPTITTLLKIASALQRPVAYFVEEQEHTPPTAVIRPDERTDIYTSHTGIHLAGITGPYDEFMVAAAYATVQPYANAQPASGSSSKDKDKDKDEKPFSILSWQDEAETTARPLKQAGR